jgi:hypothetical protein
LSKKDISLSQLIPAETKKIHLPVYKQQSGTHKTNTDMRFMEFDDISIKPIIS